jgi:hypothetical protein
VQEAAKARKARNIFITLEGRQEKLSCLGAGQGNPQLYQAGHLPGQGSTKEAHQMWSMRVVGGGIQPIKAFVQKKVVDVAECDAMFFRAAFCNIQKFDTALVQHVPALITLWVSGGVPATAL